MPFLCDVMKSWLRACVHIAFFLRHKSAGRALWRDSDDTSTFLKTSATSAQSDGTKKVRVLWKKTLGAALFFLASAYALSSLGTLEKRRWHSEKKQYMDTQPYSPSVSCRPDFTQHASSSSPPVMGSKPFARGTKPLAGGTKPLARATNSKCVPGQWQQIKYWLQYWFIELSFSVCPYSVSVWLTPVNDKLVTERRPFCVPAPHLKGLSGQCPDAEHCLASLL